MKPEVREMVICYFVKVPEVERQVRDKSAKFTKDHIFHELPFAGELHLKIVKDFSTILFHINDGSRKECLSLFSCFFKAIVDMCFVYFE